MTLRTTIATTVAATSVVITVAAAMTLAPALEQAFGFSPWHLAAVLFPIVVLMAVWYVYLNKSSVPCPPWLQVACLECGHVVPGYDFGDDRIYFKCPSCRKMTLPAFAAICHNCGGSMPIDGDMNVPATCPHCAGKIDGRRFNLGYLVNSDSHGKCHECGYDLRGQLERRCPECGAEFPAWLLRHQPGDDPPDGE